MASLANSYICQQDFTVFASIEPTEYVNHLFQLADDDNPCASNRHRGWSRLAEFEVVFWLPILCNVLNSGIVQPGNVVGGHGGVL